MPRISNIEILKKAEQPTISIRTNTKVENLPMFIGESYEKMAAYLKELEEFLSDVPYVAYHNVDIQNLDVEIGFPVSKPLPGIGRFSQILFRLERLSFACIAGHTVRWKQKEGTTVCIPSVLHAKR